MSSSALLKLQAFHGQLHKQALESARNFNALSTEEIAAYSLRFHQSVPKSFSKSDESQILQDIPGSKFLLFGDFHTLKHSQKGFLQLLVESHRLYPQRYLAVALEIFNAADQESIDLFLQNQISEETFLKQIDYHNKWGFPWENYQPIVAYCSQNNIPIIGINAQFDASNRLTKRDIFAAGLLNRWAENQSDGFCFCLIGEYHLADQHLISQLNPEFKTIRVIANVDDFALQTLGEPVVGSDYLQLGESFYCLLNTVPWVKWQSLAIWEELHSSGDHHLHPEEFDLYTEHHYDFDYQLLNVLKLLNEFLELGLSSSELTHFDLYFRPDRSTLNYLKSKLGLSRFDLAAADYGLAIDGYYYFGPTRAVALQDFSCSNFAEIAGYILFDALHKPTSEGKQEAMRARIERQVCNTLARLLMNPRHMGSDQESGYFYASKTIAESASKIYGAEYFDQLLFTSAGLNVFKNATLADEDRQNNYLLSRKLGEYIGYRIFQSLWDLSSSDFLASLQSIFKGRLDQHISYLQQDYRQVQISRDAS